MGSEGGEATGYDHGRDGEIFYLGLALAYVKRFVEAVWSGSATFRPRPAFILVPILEGASSDAGRSEQAPFRLDDPRQRSLYELLRRLVGEGPA
jgi:hypothetical protein